MAFPVMIGSIAITVLNVTDTAFLGRVGEVELGASAIGGVFYFVLVMVGVAIGIGTQILIARRAGEKKHAEIGEIFDHSFLIFLSLSVFLFLILKFAAPALLPLILSDSRVVGASIQFLEYRSYGIFFILLATVYRSFYVGIAQPRIYGYYSFLMAGVNLLLGYLLIFGNFGFPQMGIAGAGLASSISEGIGLIYLVVYTLLKPDIKEFRLFRFKNLKGSLISQNLELSAPLVVQNILSMGAWFIFFVFIEKMGERPLAVSNITRGVYMINMTPIWGFMMAANSMVSNIIGQNRKQDVMLLIHRIILLSLAVTAGMIAINLLFPYELLGLFTADRSVMEDSYYLLRIVNSAMLFFAFAIVCISAVSGTGATRMALVIEIVAILLYMIYIYLTTFYFRLSVEYVWLSEILYWVVTGAASYVYLRSRRWEKIQL
jgi:MATE family, multidrug efflux pump